MRKFLSYVAAYLIWTVILVLGVVFIMLARQALPLVSARLIAMDHPDYYMLNQQVRFASEVLMYVLGGLWLIAAVVVEDRCRVGARRGTLTRYVQRTLGPELLLLFGAGLTIRLCVGPSPLDQVVWPTLAVALVAGLALTVYGYTAFRPARVRWPGAFRNLTQ
jgi:hypothetical protein